MKSEILSFVKDSLLNLVDASSIVQKMYSDSVCSNDFMHLLDDFLCIMYLSLSFVGSSDIPSFDLKSESQYLTESCFESLYMFDNISFSFFFSLLNHIPITVIIIRARERNDIIITVSAFIH